MSATESVVANIAAATVNTEVNQHVRGGQVSSGHTEVNTVAFNVGHEEVVCTVAAHVTGHGVSRGVEGVAANPVVVGSVHRHHFRLEAGRHIGSTFVVRRGEQQSHLVGWCRTQVGGFQRQEVGFVDDRCGVDVDSRGVQCVANRGHVGSRASIDLGGRRFPGEVFYTTDGVNHGQSGGGI